MSAEIPPELRVLRDLFTTTDPVPSHLVEAGYAAPGLVRDRDDAAVRLELVSDSADMSSSTRLCGQRGRTGSRVLTFMMPGRIVEIDLVRSAARTLRATGIVISRAGQGVPAGLVAVRYPGGQCAGELDGHGAFQVDDVPRGPLSVVFRPAAGDPAIADWLVC